MRPMAMGLININNLFVVGVVFNEEGKHIRDKIKGFKLNFDSLVKWTLASRSGKNIFTVLIISICLVISYFYFLSHIRVGEIYKNEVESTTIDLEKSFLKSTVNNLIRQIESDRKMAIIHYIRNVDNQYAALNEMKNATADVYLKSLYAELGLDKELSGKPSSWTVLIWDDKKNIIYAPQGYNGQDITVLLEQIKPLLVHYRIIENQGISCLFGYSYEHVDNTVKAATAAKIKSLQFDNFKQINDRYGHHVGDQALQGVVKTVARAIRSSDELFRLGGDEFVGIFYGVSEENTPFFAGKIKEMVAALEIRAGDEVIKISVSIGVSYFRPGDGSCSEALKRADEAMYISKKKGGNQLTIL